MTTYADLHRLPEAERIKLIGEEARWHIVGVSLEKNEPEKIARYIKSVTDQFPEVHHIDTARGLTKSSVLVRFGPLAKH